MCSSIRDVDVASSGQYGRWRHRSIIRDDPNRLYGIPHNDEADLGDLDAFVAVARPASFRGAAAMRGVSASTLSEAVRRLEARLGVRLLNRTTRSVTPTEAGARLLERLAPALGEVAAALDAVNGFRDSPAGTLRLNVPTWSRALVLPPIIAALSRDASRHRAGSRCRGQLHRRACGGLRRRRAL